MTSQTQQLEQHHQQLLDDSGISEWVSRARGYGTVRDSTDARVVSYSVAQRNRTPALFIPSYDIHGSQSASQIRPDVPRSKVGSNGVAKPVKYESAQGGGSFLDVHPSIRSAIKNGADGFLITEGVRKADSFISAGGLCLALPGVWNWKGANGNPGSTSSLAAFDSIPMRGRSVAICYDSDVTQKAEVKKALRRFVGLLQSFRAEVSIILLPDLGNGKVGLDDFLVAGHTVADVWLLARPADDVLAELDRATVGASVRERTQLGNALRIRDEYGERIAWCPATGWYVWDGEVWARDARHRVRHLIHGLKDIIAREVGDLRQAGVGDDEIKAHWKLWADSQSGTHIGAVLTELEGLCETSWELFDADPSLLTVGNGILRFGNDGVELLDFDPRYKLTRRTDVNYNPTARCTFFDDTLLKALPDPDVRSFFHRSIGYSVQGGNSEQVIFMAHGSGQNLKSTVLGAVKKAIGKEFGLEVDPSSLRPGSGGGSGASPDKVRLLGSRMVLAAEANDQLDTEFLKRVSGGEEIVTRQLHGKTIAFRPDFTLWLMFNAPPTINDTSHGMWRRVRIIPFTQRVADPIDAGTVDMLLEEQKEGILRWVVDGYTAYKREGLTPPAAVLAETQAVRDELDWFSQFIEETYKLGPNYRVPKPQVWSDFESWRGQNRDLKKVRKMDVNVKAADRFGDPKKIQGAFYFMGLGFTEFEDGRLKENQGQKNIPLGQKSEDQSENLPLGQTSSDQQLSSDMGQKSTLGVVISDVSSQGENEGVSTAESEQTETDSKNRPSCPKKEVSAGQSMGESGAKTPLTVHPYTRGLSTWQSRLDNEAPWPEGVTDRGRRPFVCGSSASGVMWVSGRQGPGGVSGCGTELVRVPDGDLFVCPVCTPESLLVDDPNYHA